MHQHRTLIPTAILLCCLLACSDSSSDDADAGGEAGAQATAGTNAGATATGGMQSTAGASGAGDGGSSGSAGNTGGASGSAGMENTGGAGVGGEGGGNSGPVCPGAIEPAWLQELDRCTSSTECNGAGLTTQCRIEQLSFPCGGIGPPMECTFDEECGPDRVCIQQPSCGGTMCTDACDATSCESTATCEDGRCVQKRCDEAGAIECPANYFCDPSDALRADEHGCIPESCEAGVSCLPGWDCDANSPLSDPHGCQQRACNDASDCECGACIDGLCEPYAGACLNIAPPP